jgi:hypothetical protein
LHQHQFIDEILVWNNDPEVGLILRGQKVRVLEPCQNVEHYGRFLCAREAKNETIYVQGDDVVVENVPKLYDNFLADDSRITHALQKRHLRRRERYVYADGQIALLGWGAFFRKEWLKVLDTYVAVYGVDLLLKSKADKLFSLLLGRSHSSLPAQIQSLPDGGEIRYQDEGHIPLESLAVRRASELLRISKSVRFPVKWNVVVTSHNYGKYLREAVDSILRNDADYVVTIVDDASTDETSEIGQQLSHDYSHVSYIKHEPQVGVNHARNTGIAAIDVCLWYSLMPTIDLGRTICSKPRNCLDPVGT